MVAKRTIFHMGNSNYAGEQEMSIHQGHSHDRTPEADTSRDVPQPRRQEFMLAGWHVRPIHHCVTDGLETRQLEPRLMTLLCLLASRPGDVLSRNELMESLWPRVVVNENSLTRAVSDLRRKLQDSNGTGFIETVPKQGYKLIAPVTTRIADSTAVAWSPAAEAEAAGIEEHSSSSGVAQWLRRHATALGTINVTLAIALVGSLSPFVLSTDPGAATEQPRVARFTTEFSQGVSGDEPSREQHGDIIRRDDARPYVPTVATSGMDNPPGNRNAAEVTVSPDGELVAFTRRTDKGSTLLIGSMLDSSDPLQVYSSQHRIDHLHWSPIGTALMFSVAPTASHASLDEREEGRLMLFDLQDLSVRELYRSGRDPDDTRARFNDALNIT